MYSVFFYLEQDYELTCLQTLPIDLFRQQRNLQCSYLELFFLKVQVTWFQPVSESKSEEQIVVFVVLSVNIKSLL